MKNKTIIKKRLKKIYGRDASEEVFFKIKKIINKYKNEPIIIEKRKKYKDKAFFSEKDSTLITYGDSIIRKGEKPLETLYKFLRKHIKDSITGVHILPFYPYSSDDGFSVIDYKKVNPKLGDWNDIKKIGKDYRLMTDLVMNHISSKSKWFQGFLKGDENYKNYFIWFDKKINTSSVFRPRMNPLLTPLKTRWGTKYVWTTFSQDQIDLNFKNPDVLLEMVDIMLFYISNSVEIIRLDAVAFLWKKLGTSCIHLKRTHEIIKLFRNILEEIAPYAIIITETNVPYKENISYFGNNNEAHAVYQFPLPSLVLDAFLRHDSTYLYKLFKKVKLIKKNYLFINYLASHDGIMGLLASKKYLNENQFNNMLKEVKKHSGYISYKDSPSGKIPYEFNITYFDAINNPNLKIPTALGIKKFIASQSILVFSKGVPGIYIHSLLGSRNYNRGVEKAFKTEKIGNLNNKYRQINREKLDYNKIEKELKDKSSLRAKVLKNYLKLLEIKKKNKDFNPYLNQKAVKSDKKLFIIKRGKTTISICLSAPFEVQIQH